MLPIYICPVKVRNIVQSYCYCDDVNLNAPWKRQSILLSWLLAEPKYDMYLTEPKQSLF